MASPQTPLSAAIAKTEAILASYKTSGLTRRQYCAREGLSLSMLDYHQRRSRQLRERQPGDPSAACKPVQKLLRVELESTRPADPAQAAAGFTLALPKGRRIESGWDFAEEQLTRLIRVVEAA